jgi:hypothetical protein
MSDVAAVQGLIKSRLAPAYKAAHFTPPYPTWPFSEAAVAGAASVSMTPRTILMRCDAFRRKCIEQNRVEICTTLIERLKPDSRPEPLDGLGTEFQRLVVAADISNLMTSGDDGESGRLLQDVFDLFARQFDPNESYSVESKDDPARRIPPLHGRLTFTYHDENDRERHFCFRALEHTHAISFQARLRAALTASGISARMPDRDHSRLSCGIGETQLGASARFSADGLRRQFITLLGGVPAAAATLWPHPLAAQQAGRVYRIGFFGGALE